MRNPSTEFKTAPTKSVYNFSNCFDPGRGRCIIESITISKAIGNESKNCEFFGSVIKGGVFIGGYPDKLKET